VSLGAPAEPGAVAAAALISGLPSDTIGGTTAASAG
jgi:hypothetical protein